MSSSRKGKTRRWHQQHINDPYVKAAQKEGLRSRAAFKLKEIQEKQKVVKPGMRVLELGAAPGGWTELLAQWVGDKGHVFALDLLPMDPISNVTVLQGDIQDEAFLADLTECIGEGGVDAVFSDMAPNLSGIASVDTAKAYGLLQMALEVANMWLVRDGILCTKAFHGYGFDDIVKQLRANYAKVTIYKPKASRAHSKEVYIIAQGKRG